MAYRRTFRKKLIKRRTTGKSWYQRKYNAMQLAAKAWKGVRYIRGLVNSERFHKDFNYGAGTNVPNTGIVTNITGITQGDSDIGRTGNSILLRDITYRFKFEINPSVASNTTILLMLVRDNQQISDTNPGITDVLTTSTCESLLALGTLGRFSVLSRKLYTLTPATGGKPCVEVKGYMNLQKHVRYNGAASTDIQKNGHYLMMLSSETSNYPTLVGTIRISYHDN